MIALTETRTILKAVLEEATISQRQFWDFYAVFANGLEDIPGIDVDHIVDQAWIGIFDPYARMIYYRIVRSSLLNLSGVDDGDRRVYDDKGDYAPSVGNLVRRDLKKYWLKDNADITQVLGAIDWFNKSEEAKNQDYVEYFTSTDGVWAKLARDIVAEYRKANTSRQSKAMSVDRMLAWSHHNDTMADYVGKWMSVALDARSHGNMNTLLAHASPSVRDALKSAAHGVGRPELGAADRAEIEMNRKSTVKKIRRNGNHFIVDEMVINGMLPPEARTTRNIWNYQLAEKEFELRPDGVYDFVRDKLWPYRQEASDGVTIYRHRFSTIFTHLDRRLKSSDQ